MVMETKKESTNKKSLWSFVFLAAALYGLWKLLRRIAVRVLYLFLKDPYLLSGDAASIGIIGGADGPTAIFITTPDWTHWAVPLILLVVGILGFLRLNGYKRK